MYEIAVSTSGISFIDTNRGPGCRQGKTPWTDGLIGAKSLDISNRYKAGNGSGPRDSIKPVEPVDGAYYRDMNMRHRDPVLIVVPDKRHLREQGKRRTCRKPRTCRLPREARAQRLVFPGKRTGRRKAQAFRLRGNGAGRRSIFLPGTNIGSLRSRLRAGPSGFRCHDHGKVIEFDPSFSFCYNRRSFRFSSVTGAIFRNFRLKLKWGMLHTHRRSKTPVTFKPIYEGETP